MHSKRITISKHIGGYLIEMWSVEKQISVVVETAHDVMSKMSQILIEELTEENKLDERRREH